MKVEVINSERRVKEILPQWKAIAEYMPINYLPEWLGSWWKTYKCSWFEIHMYALWNDEEQLTAILPMMMDFRQSGIRKMTLIAADSSDRLGLTVSKTTTSEMVSLIVDCIENDHSWDELCFSNILADDPVMDRMIREIIARGYTLTETMQDAYSGISVNKSWKEFLSDKTKNVRHAYRESVTGVDRFTFCVNKECKNEDIERAVYLHKKRWNAVCQVSAFYDRQKADFVKQIRDIFTDEGKFVIFELYLNSVLVAYRLGVIHNNVYFDWNTAYDPDYANMSPGKALIKYIYEYCWENQIGMIDMMKGHERYKSELSTESSYVKGITVFNRKYDFEWISPSQKMKFGLSEIKLIIYVPDSDETDKGNRINMMKGLADMEIRTLIAYKDCLAVDHETLQSYITDSGYAPNEILIVAENMDIGIRNAQDLFIHTCLVTDRADIREQVARLPHSRRPEITVDSIMALSRLIKGFKESA